MKRTGRYLGLLLLCLGAGCLFAGSAYGTEQDGYGYEEEPYDEDDGETEEYEDYEEQDEEEDRGTGRKKPAGKKLDLIAESARLDLPLYFQFPELPTGCEVTALAMALGGLGYEIDPTDLARDYLDYGEDGDMLWKFQGDPFTEEGGGIFPPGLASAANAFLEDMGSDVTAYEATGCSFEEILNYSAEGCPVVLWVTLHYDEPLWVDDGAELDGISYGWYMNEHCVALRGYDVEDGLVLLADPSDGYTEVDLQEFRELYEQIGYALVLM